MHIASVGVLVFQLYQKGSRKPGLLEEKQRWSF